MTSFSAIFAIVLILNIALTLRSSDYYKKWSTGGGMTVSATSMDDGDKEHQRKHTALLQRYLLVYLLATMSDWLQGPYVYALYAEYGFKQEEIAQLFVAGFGSSMIFGSFVGGMADWGGRRAFVVLFAVVYAASCMTKRTYVERRL
jgi:predicted MFS family arabinose efflux permease